MSRDCELIPKVCPTRKLLSVPWKAFQPFACSAHKKTSLDNYSIWISWFECEKLSTYSRHQVREKGFVKYCFERFFLHLFLMAIHPNVSLRNGGSKTRSQSKVSIFLNTVKLIQRRQNHKKKCRRGNWFSTTFTFYGTKLPDFVMSHVQFECCSNRIKAAGEVLMQNAAKVFNAISHFHWLLIIVPTLTERNAHLLIDVN